VVGRGNAGPVEAVENQTQVSHRSHRPLEIASGDSHIPTATATAVKVPSSKSKPKRVA
jgi:hypothetical protein